MKVRDLYRAPVYCVRTTDDLYHARNEMISRGVTKLPVLDEASALAGILTLTDLVEDANLATSNPSRIRLREGEVANAMTRRPFTLDASEQAVTAARELSRRQVSAAPVLADDALAGILTVHDLLPFVRDRVGGRHRVTDMMEDPVRVHRHDSIARVAAKVLASPSHAALVTESGSDGGFVGLVTLESLLFASALVARSPRGKRIASARKREYGGRKDARHVEEEAQVAEDVMWEDVPTVRPEAGAAAAANRFLHEEADVLPVVHDGQVVGMLSKKGFLKATLTLLA